MPVQMIDSRQKMLTPPEIASIHMKNTGESRPPQAILLAIGQELSDPSVVHFQIGNTLFIFHRTEGGGGFARALNADTAQNYANNTKQALQHAKDNGFNRIAILFKGDEVMRLLQSVERSQAIRGMSIKFTRTGGDGIRADVTLNPGA